MVLSGRRSGVRDLVQIPFPRWQGHNNNNSIHNNNNNSNDNNNNNETGSRSPCMRPRSDPQNFGQIERGEKQTNNID